MASAFEERLGRSALEVSRLGDAEQENGDGPAVYTYAAHLGSAASGTPQFLGTMRVALWEADKNAMIFQSAARPAVPTAVMARLATTLAAEMGEFGADKVAAIARLDGLCAFIANTKAWEPFDEPSPGWEKG